MDQCGAVMEQKRTLMSINPESACSFHYSGYIFLCHALNYEANCQMYTFVILKQELNLVQKMKRLWSF